MRVLQTISFVALTAWLHSFAPETTMFSAAFLAFGIIVVAMTIVLNAQLLLLRRKATRTHNGLQKRSPTY